MFVARSHFRRGRIRSLAISNARADYVATVSDAATYPPYRLAEQLAYLIRYGRNDGETKFNVDGVALHYDLFMFPSRKREKKQAFVAFHAYCLIPAISILDRTFYRMNQAKQASIRPHFGTLMFKKNMRADALKVIEKKTTNVI